MKKYITLAFTLFALQTLFAQKKNITLEDIWKTGTFASKGIYGLTSMKDGIHYSTLKNDTIFCYEYAKESKPEIITDKNNLLLDGKNIIIDSYQFSEDE